MACLSIRRSSQSVTAAAKPTRSAWAANGPFAGEVAYNVNGCFLADFRHNAEPDLAILDIEDASATSDSNPCSPHWISNPRY